MKTLTGSVLGLASAAAVLLASSGTMTGCKSAPARPTRSSMLKVETRTLYDLVQARWNALGDDLRSGRSVDQVELYEVGTLLSGLSLSFVKIEEGLLDPSEMMRYEQETLPELKRRAMLVFRGVQPQDETVHMHDVLFAP